MPKIALQQTPFPLIEGSRPLADPAGNARIAIYSQDSLGLGHLRRNTQICKQFLTRTPSGKGKVLLIADSPVAPFFRLPEGVDYIKLPSIRKVSAGCWQPTQLRISNPEVRRLRSTLLKDAFLSYLPDLVLVDHMPGGAQGELLPALEALRKAHPGCSVVLGLRDILDDRQVITRVWKSEGAYQALRRYYNRVLIYGVKEIFNTAGTYQIPQPPQGICYCGYVVNEDPVEPESQVRQSLSISRKKFVFVSAGGGADSHPLMQTYLRALRLLGNRADFASLMALGVNLPPEQSRQLRAEAMGLPVEIVPFVSDSLSHLAAADLVVCMAGYNTLSEVLSLRKKSLVVPRSGPSAEQSMRARVFAERGLIDMIEPKDLSPRKLADRLVRDLERDDYPAHGARIDMLGAERASARLLELIHDRFDAVNI
jgi:predicted glycosyltransferase